MNPAAIPNPPRGYQYILHYRDGGLYDIVKVVMKVANDDCSLQVKEFVKKFNGYSSDREKLYQLWLWVRMNIKYVEDSDNKKLINLWESRSSERIKWRGLRTSKQFIKDPLAVLTSKTADCKSMSELIYHSCLEMSIPGFVRFTSYDSSQALGHVYPVAILDGQCIPVDAVWHKFGDEKPPTYFENYLPEMYSKDAEMLRAVRTSRPHVSAIGNIDTWWNKLKNWQKAVAVCIGSAIAFKIIE